MEFKLPMVIECDGNRRIVVSMPLKTCDICKSDMVSTFYGNRSIPYEISQQIKSIGVKFGSQIRNHENREVCSECVENITVKCYNCLEVRKVSEIQERFGDPADCLCKYCFETVTAKRWEELCDHLEDEHRYDYD